MQFEVQARRLSPRVTDFVYTGVVRGRITKSHQVRIIPTVFVFSLERKGDVVAIDLSQLRD